MGEPISDRVMFDIRRAVASTYPEAHYATSWQDAIMHRRLLLAEVDRLRAELLARVDAAAAVDDDLDDAPTNVENDAKPKVGALFTHARFIDGQRDPELCRVTRLAHGDVFYRVGVRGGASGGRFRCSREYFFSTALGGWVS